jgi:hypothetical protein
LSLRTRQWCPTASAVCCSVRLRLLQNKLCPCCEKTRTTAQLGSRNLRRWFGRSPPDFSGIEHAASHCELMFRRGF